MPKGVPQAATKIKPESIEAYLILIEALGGCLDGLQEELNECKQDLLRIERML